MALTIYKLATRVLVAAALALSLAACETTSEGASSTDDLLILGEKADTNSTLVTQVQRALKNNPETMLLRIKVLAVEDVIILKGMVDNEQLSHTAERVAGNVAGVRHVTNNLYLAN